jgi:hypothetical protein
MGRVKVALEGVSPRGLSAEAVVNLFHVACVADATQDLGSEHLTAQQVRLALADAEQLEKAIGMVPSRTPSEDDVELSRYLSDRIVATLGQIVLSRGKSRDRAAKSGSSLEKTADAMPRDESAQKMLWQLAAGYERDARRNQMVAYFLNGIALLLLIAAVVIALLGIHAASDKSRFSFTEFGAYGLVSLAILVGAAFVARSASRSATAAQEAVRLQRQFEGLDGYLLPMSGALRELIRGSLVQRLFPGNIDNDEPWREPRWPDSESLLDAISADRRVSPKGSSRSRAEPTPKAADSGEQLR